MKKSKYPKTVPPVCTARTRLGTMESLLVALDVETQICKTAGCVTQCSAWDAPIIGLTRTDLKGDNHG